MLSLQVELRTGKKPTTKFCSIAEGENSVSKKIYFRVPPSPWNSTGLDSFNKFSHSDVKYSFNIAFLVGKNKF